MTESVLQGRFTICALEARLALAYLPSIRTVLKGVFLAAMVMFLAECLRVFVGINFHEVIPGKCYRSAQPDAEFLEYLHRNKGFRSILNLRDENEDEEWYHEEKEAAERLGLKLFNAGLSSREQPPDENFREFVRAMDTCAEPVLIHCANGNDRTGFASAVYLMMHTDTSIAEARRHLSIRYGHFYWTQASCLHRILNSYEDWLKDNNKLHTADHFREWAYNVYRQEPKVAN